MTSWKQAALTLLTTTLLTNPTTAYITTGLPAHTHRAFLRKLTDDICNTSPGTLTTEKVKQTAMLMRGWAASPEKILTSQDLDGKARAMAVEGLLKRMIDERRAGNEAAVVKTEDYNAVMKSWAVSGEGASAALRVQEILFMMQEMYEVGLDGDVKPNLDSFKIAIEAWSKVEEDGASRAHGILEWMYGLYNDEKNDVAAPDTACFHQVLKSWAVSRKLESPIMTEQLITWMQHLESSGLESVQVDTLCFNIVMSSWLKSGDLSAEKRIRQIFEYMDKASRNGHTNLKPDAATYNMVISSMSPAVKKYSDSCAARRADKILARMEKGYLAGDETLRPDTIVYNQVIDYWAKTQSERGHFLKARDVLDRQIAMHSCGVVNKCKPDVMSYTSVIAACASTYGSWGEKKRAFELAHKTFMECCQHSQPNEVTYGIMFKAVSRLIQSQKEKDRYSKTLFGLTVDDGCLGEMALTRFRDAASKDLFTKLTNGVSSYSDLPPEWKPTGSQKKSESRKTSKLNNKLQP